MFNYAEPNPHFFYFSSSNFTVQDHILSTAVDALSRILFKGKKENKRTDLFCCCAMTSSSLMAL